MPYRNVLETAHRLALQFLAGIRDRPVNAREMDPLTPVETLPVSGGDPEEVLKGLADLVDRGGVATPGPRYFGFVTGGTLPVAIAADWLVSAWDQNSALHVMSPAMSQIEDLVASWLLDLFRLPSASSVGFVTGATMANTTCLAAARDEVLRRMGWDVELHGLQDAPRITVVAGNEAHASIEAACRLVGLGTLHTHRVDADDQGRMIPSALERVLADVEGALIVCLQAGHVNTGACDPCSELVAIARAKGAWIHVDGAFGLWARTVDRLRPMTEGLELADSWAVDAHKWLNVPYDSGVAIVAHPAPHRASMAQRASYLLRATGERRDGMDWTPEASRRARAVAIYAVLLTLGRDGVADLVMRCCDLASRMADRLRGHDGVEVLNDVVLNQVLVQFRDGATSNVTPDVIAAVQQGSVCWAGGTTWRGEPAMRISVSNWSTRVADIDLSADAILAATRRARHRDI